MDRAAEILDGVAMNRKHPATFGIPDERERGAVMVGDCVKITVERERFWVDVVEADGEKLVVRVESDLIDTEDHGLHQGDTLEIERRHVIGLPGSV